MVITEHCHLAFPPSPHFSFLLFGAAGVPVTQPCGIGFEVDTLPYGHGCLRSAGPKPGMSRLWAARCC